MISFCVFCSKRCKLESGGHWFCPNGHYIIKVEADKQFMDMLQPRSVGNHIEGENIYRLNHIKGDFCDDMGKALSDI
tara:strand:- start:103 stop:333 length:231 start_codon:yes stop_codon:yes gene_type:complete